MAARRRPAWLHASSVRYQRVGSGGQLLWGNKRSRPEESGRRWRLAICAVKSARRISLDFFFQMLYPTRGGF